MIISVINHTAGEVLDEELQTAIRAINRQIREDYEPYWHIGGELRLEGKSWRKPSKQTLNDMRGDAVLYLWNSVDADDALGYHDANNRGVPYGFVFTALAKRLGESWTVTLSHEALEMLGDQEVNLLVQGAHPAEPERVVFHWYEMCDAVQAETYEIDGVTVSNFVLPLYFTGGEEKGGRNDFLGRGLNGKTLRSFGVNPGGYVGFFDPEKGDHDTFFGKGDKIAARRLELKSKAKCARRGIRYQRYASREAPSAKQREQS
jgi:hypothetical protein